VIKRREKWLRPLVEADQYRGPSSSEEVTAYQAEPQNLPTTIGSGRALPPINANFKPCRAIARRKRFSDVFMVLRVVAREGEMASCWTRVPSPHHGV